MAEQVTDRADRKSGTGRDCLLWQRSPLFCHNGFGTAELHLLDGCVFVVGTSGFYDLMDGFDQSNDPLSRGLRDGPGDSWRSARQAAHSFMVHDHYSRIAHRRIAELQKVENPLSETKITVIYDNPTDPEAFEKSYGTDQLAAAKAIPGHIRVETSKVWPKEDGSPTPAYRMIDLYYPDYDAASAAVTTPEAGAFFTAMAALSTGGVRVLFSEIEVTE